MNSKTIARPSPDDKFGLDEAYYITHPFLGHEKAPWESLSSDELEAAEAWEAFLKTDVPMTREQALIQKHGAFPFACCAGCCFLDEDEFKPARCGAVAEGKFSYSPLECPEGRP